MNHPLQPGETFDAWLARIQPPRRAELTARIRRARISPLTPGELATWPTLFATDREHKVFLAWLREERHRHGR